METKVPKKKETQLAKPTEEEQDAKKPSPLYGAWSESSGNSDAHCSRILNRRVVQLYLGFYPHNMKERRKRGHE